MLDLRCFREIWSADFEWRGADGDRPDPQCVVAWERRSGRKIQLRRNEMGPFPPYPVEFRNRCSSPTMLPPKSVATSLSVGRSPRAFSTCTPSSADT